MTYTTYSQAARAFAGAAVKQSYDAARECAGAVVPGYCPLASSTLAARIIAAGMVC